MFSHLLHRGVLGRCGIHRNDRTAAGGVQVDVVDEFVEVVEPGRRFNIKCIIFLSFPYVFPEPVLVK